MYINLYVCIHKYYLHTYIIYIYREREIERDIDR